MMDGKPPTEADYWARLFQTEENIAEIRTMLDTHTGAAVQRHTDLTAAIGHLENTTIYYGDELVRAYHRLNRRVARIERRVEALTEEVDPIDQDQAA